MNESNYLSGEFMDEFLHEQADAGDYFLDLNSGHLDNDSGIWNKKRRVFKVLSSSRSQTKYMQPSHAVNAAKSATGVLSIWN